MEPILTIDNLNSFGGNMLRQGDKSQLKYRLRDVGNKNLAISSKPCQVRMYGRNYTTVVYETSTTVSSDNTVTFTIDKVLPKGTFYLEFTVGDYIFPTDHKEFFEITPSGKGMESNIIEIVGVDAVVRKAVDLINDDPSLIIDEDKLVSDIINNTEIGSINEYHQQFKDVMKELSEDKDYHSLPEIAGARGGFDTLGERLNYTATQLAQTDSRIDNVIATAGDGTIPTELSDIRVGADGSLYDTAGQAVRSQFNDFYSFKNNATNTVMPANLLNLNDENFKESTMISNTTGVESSHSAYNTTGYIPVTAGKKIIVTRNGVPSNVRFIASFDSAKQILPTKGSNVDTNNFIVPEGVAYARLSYANRSDFINWMVALVDSDINVSPPFEPYFEPYTKLIVSTDKTLTALDEPADAKAVGDALGGIYQSVTPYKNPSETIKVSSATANQEIKIPDFPEMLKTGQSISYSAKFSVLGTDDKIEIGFINPTYATYQSWFEITSDRVKWLLSGSNAILNNLHNLTIKDYIDINFKVTTDTGQLEILIVTNGGSYSFKQTSDSTRFNAIGTLTARATMLTSDVVLSGTCTQFKCDTWLIGDSYFGSGPARIGGKLMEWGYSNNVLIDGLGGLNSAQAYAEFQKLLKYGTPKTLVWYLGMNDNQTTVNSHFNLVEQLCDQNGIDLIFNRIPLVPPRLTENNAVNAYVMASGRRYIDSYSAVGANASGNWYEGHLSSDNVHPDPLGASALTARMISDVPEILA